uniref:Major capsid protein n=1 Tax=Dulem virus 224 TaxID=3145701 RepID=A0AAU8AWN9_9VIRU
MKTSIGKNTLGGGKKMTIEMRNYNRSTHDLSQILRTSMSVGTLVPTFCELVTPGDTFPIKIRSQALTHPTIGPLFGSFKVQNDFFFCPMRLYNAMLHNNTLGVGLDMKKVKFPYYQIPTNSWSETSYLKGSAGTIVKEVNPSSLPYYLGQARLRSTNSTDYEEIKTIKYCMYFDIFKNYYANKQEDNFYVIKGSSNINWVELASINNSYTTFAAKKNAESNYTIETIIANSGESTRTNTAGAFGFKINGYNGVDFGNVVMKLNIVLKYKTDEIWIAEKRVKGTKSIQEWINEGVLKKILITPISANFTENSYIFTFNADKSTVTSIEFVEPSEINIQGGNYAQYKLSAIDQMREDILREWGNAWDTVGATFITDMFQSYIDEDGETVPNCIAPQCGLALKTYQSDINTNWIKTEWIDGDNGINAVTAIDTSSGSFTLDTLNLAKKVYDMLNRIAISDGSYNAWIQVVYTSGGLNHIETPIYLGGSSYEIEFQEVINQAGTDQEPLGSLAGRGVATNHKGGEIKFKADEPGYIMCITSITPRVDYFQGNKWDNYLDTMDDLHKPQLDGIGFQDRLYRHINASAPLESHKKSIGKQPAWIEYMTAINRTAGNFALIENEGWMCLNRIFGDINTYTTYIQPHLYNSIFAETDISAQNFWIQIYFDCKPRRVMSAKQMPNV